MGEKIGRSQYLETEIIRIYRGSILIELDRVGCGEGFEKICLQMRKPSGLKLFLMQSKLMVYRQADTLSSGYFA